MSAYRLLMDDKYHQESTVTVESGKTVLIGAVKSFSWTRARKHIHLPVSQLNLSVMDSHERFFQKEAAGVNAKIVLPK